MMPEKNANIPDDEIDFNSIGKKVWSFINYILFLIKNNITTVFLFLLLAVGLSFSLKYIIPRSYKSSFIIRPTDRNEKVHLKIIEDLEMLLKLKDYKSLASELKVNENVAQTLLALKKINYSPKSDFLDSSNTTEIIVELTDYKQFVPVQNAILNYLEQNPFFIKIKELQKKHIAAKLSMVDKDIASLDSLKQLQLAGYNKQSNSIPNGIFIKDLINPTAVYVVSQDKINQKSSLISQQEFIDGFQLVKPIITVKKHSWPPRILIMCTVIVPVFMLFCLVFLHVRFKKSERRKNV